MANDYRNRLLDGIENCQRVIGHSVQFLLSVAHSRDNQLQPAKNQSKPRITIDVDDPTSLNFDKKKPKLMHIPPGGGEVAVFNPLVKRRSHLVR